MTFEGGLWTFCIKGQYGERSNWEIFLCMVSDIILLTLCYPIFKSINIYVHFLRLCFNPRVLLRRRIVWASLISDSSRRVTRNPRPDWIVAALPTWHSTNLLLPNKTTTFSLDYIHTLCYNKLSFIFTLHSTLNWINVQIEFPSCLWWISFSFLLGTSWPQRCRTSFSFTLPPYFGSSNHLF